MKIVVLLRRALTAEVIAMKLVSIIISLFFVTSTGAATPCVRSLVPDSVEEQVQEMAVVLAELTGEMRTKSHVGLQAYAGILGDMTRKVEQIRADFYSSPQAVATGIEELKAMMSVNVPRIKTALAAVPSAAPRNFMKREVLSADMRDWNALEIESYLRESTEPPKPLVVPPNRTPPPQPIFEGLPNHGPSTLKP